MKRRQRLLLVRCLPTALLLLAFGSLLVALTTTVGLGLDHDSSTAVVLNSGFEAAVLTDPSSAPPGAMTIDIAERRTEQALGNATKGSQILKRVGSSTKPLKLVHVWSPYVVPVEYAKRKKKIFYPLDQAQNVTWGSMLRAQEAFNSNNQDAHIQVWCAILWMDVEVLHNYRPSLCQPDNTIILNRSSHTEYPDLLPPIHFPFVQDVLQVPVDYDYLVLTNTDISLIESFYTQIQTQIRENNYDAFTVNRRQVPRFYRGNLLNSNNLSFIESELVPEGKLHPGTDCFILQKDVVQSYSLGNLFVGHPPWGSVLKTSLKNFVATNFKNFTSIPGWTFHLGDDPKWSKPRYERNLTVEEDAFLDECAFGITPRFYTVHGFQNTWNCAEGTSGLLDFITGMAVNNNTTARTPKFLTSKGVKRVKQYGLSRIPIIANWRQNRLRGTISGELWNSRDFIDGTKIRIRRMLKNTSRAWAEGYVINKFGNIYHLDGEEEES